MRRRLLNGLFLALAVAAAGLLLLWNPGAPGRPADGRVHVRYWYVVGARDDVPYHARRFNEIQDSIVVEATPIPWQEHEKKILTAILSGNPPDVVSQFIPVVKWASRRALMPLDGFIRASRFDTTLFFPALWQEMQWQGRPYGVPVNSASYALFYNRALFREAGLDPGRPPATWDELRRMAHRLIRRDGRGRLVQVGFLPDYGSLQAVTLMAWQLGARFLSPDGATVQMNTPPVVQALAWVRDYYRGFDYRAVQGFASGLGVGEQHGFLSGRVAMAVLDMSYLDQIERYAPTLDYGVAMIPTFPGRPMASSAGSWWLAIPRHARHPEAAWAFMQFATRREVQLQEIQSTEEDLFPANRRAAYDPSFLKDERVAVFVRQMDHAHSPTLVPMAHDVFWREFYAAQERVVHGVQEPSAALAQAQQVVQDALDRNLEYDRYVQAHLEIEPAGEGTP